MAPSPSAVPSSLPPESPREKLGNASLILRANTRVTLDSAFQPIGAYHRALELLDAALAQLDGRREEIEKLAVAYGEEQFDAGAWTSDNDEPFDSIAGRCDDALRALREKLP